ncbi:MAG: hypothetical protein H0T82_03125 [Sphingomonas sp.]|nr:hypothetical protein [Sphingomonas sp.]
MTEFAAKDMHRIRSTAALLTSDNDGEALGAARALCRLLNQHGLDPAGVVGAGLVGRSISSCRDIRNGPAPVSILRPHQLDVRMCLAYPHLLDEWERSFLGNVVAARSISEKQRSRLQVIVAKVERGRR